MPHLSLKLITFLKSFWFHIWLGFPKSPQYEIDRRYSICLSCNDFDTKNHQCTICGCNINNKKMFLNKLAWADQECPIKKWGKYEH